MAFKIKPKFIVGIDPGLDGAILFLNLDGTIAKKVFMPIIVLTVKRRVKKRAKNKITGNMEKVMVKDEKTGEMVQSVVTQKGKKTLLDMDGLFQLFTDEQQNIKHAFLEQVGPRPSQTAQSGFTFGDVFGCTKMALVGNKIPYTLVTPQQWQKTMHVGVNKDMEPKDRSRLICSRMYPSDDLKKSNACKVRHDGLCDALLIAEYGRRQLIGG